MESALLADYLRIRNEYHMTIRVLAVVCEQLLALKQMDAIEITDDVLNASPDLHAHRDEERHCTVIRTER